MVAVFALAVLQAGPDPDLWGRMLYGKAALAAGVLVLPTDVFSYTVAGAPWMDHEWGFSLLSWGLFDVGGWPAVRAYQVFMFVAAASFVVRRIAVPETSPGILPLLALPILPVLATGFGGPRAQTVTYVSFVLLLECLRRARDGRARWAVVSLLPLPCWVNMHGGFLAGMGVVGVWTMTEGIRGFLSGKAANARAGALALLAGVCVAAINPWGTGFFLPLVDAAVMPRPFVREWQATDPLSPLGIGAFGLLILDAVWLRRCRPRAAEIAIVVVTAVLGLGHQRHMVFHAIAVGILVAPDIAALTMRSAPWESRPAALSAMKHGLSLAILGVASVLVARIWAPVDDSAYPARAMEFAETSGVKGNVVADFDWSQYVLFRGWPGMKVAFDGRYEEVYPPAEVDTFLAWSYGLPGWRQLVDDPRAEWALVVSESDRDVRMRGLSAWAEVYRDEQAVWFRKQP